MADPGVGDEFLAVKPYKGQMKPPTGFKKPRANDNQAPDIKLELEWVYGYRGYDNRNNMNCMANGKLAYYVAGVVCAYDPVQHTQQHYTGHSDDVMAIAFAPDQRYIATGELGNKPKVAIIDTETMAVCEITDSHLRKSVLCMAFSQDGTRLAVVCKDDDHTISIFNTSDMQNPVWIASSKGDRAEIYDIDFSADPNKFVVVGAKLFKEFTITGNKIKGVMGKFGNLDPWLPCCVFNGQDCLTGNRKGDLYLWNGTTPKVLKEKLHEGLIDAICCDGNYVLTGGRDNKVQIMDKSYTNLFAIDLSLLPGSVCPQPRALSLNSSKTKLYVGTFGCELAEIPIDLSQKSSQEGTVLSHGHYGPGKPTNEVWGLCTDPQSPNLVVSCSDDATVRVWDVKAHKQATCIKLDEAFEGRQFPMEKAVEGAKKAEMINGQAKGRSVDISPDGKYMAVGTFGGLLRVFQREGGNWKPIEACEITAVLSGATHKMEWIEDLKFSPDSTKLAVTSHNDRIFMFNVPNFKEFKVFGKSSSFVTHLDWSLDS